MTRRTVTVYADPSPDFPSVTDGLEKEFAVVDEATALALGAVRQMSLADINMLIRTAGVGVLRSGASPSDRERILSVLVVARAALVQMQQGDMVEGPGAKD